MQARNRFGAALLTCGLALAGTAAAAEPQSATDCFLAGFRASNADALAPCYAEDAVMWFPGGPMAKGRTAIRDGFAGYFAGATVKDATLTQLGEEAMGDTRVTWGTYVVNLVDKKTQAASVERGRYTDVQKKIDGRWVYIVDHPSDDPAPAAK
ncbi:hypothetical protein LYSHEL_04300 [Lysobacter helvus]|uniref:SnoaL-like domain-containing protein n=2 Tax=Lysobacteraceae TaxID=32033 RepID=A0ABM7Q2A5_9GAMM|nr:MULTISPECIES: nuclear transport factor 2 family protein [Lysobacter]BCT91406.1 hypothetical protein LYSCAS_04300 [Lysobacter caseinilyticus]BCT94559.1 hypothetical protein LYSHEL_04300 [Lysobacter helvus]